MEVQENTVTSNAASTDAAGVKKPFTKRNTRSYKSELEQMRGYADKWRAAAVISIALNIAIIIYSLII